MDARQVQMDHEKELKVEVREYTIMQASSPVIYML